MRRRAGIAFSSIALLVVYSCASTRDIYAGSDVRPLDGGALDARAEVELDASTGPGPVVPPPPPSCTGTTADCDGIASNGCEVDLAADAMHCGQCTNACQFPDCACRDGRFVTSCPAGRADCDGNPQNGCEVELDNSMQHCGACGRLCHTNGHDAIAAVCVGGKCQITCQREAFPEGDCDNNPDNGCETPLWTNENCSACGVRCACSNGVCS